MVHESAGNIRGVLWDLDGTLVDSGEYHFQSWRTVMAREGIDLSREQFDQSFGQKNDRILKEWLGPDAPPDRVRRIADEKEAEYRKIARAHGLSALPGAREWVSRLAADGWCQAIASSAPRQNIDVMLDLIGLSGEFQSIVSAEDVATGKPDPQVFLVAAGKLHIPPARAVVVEDAEAGIEAARRAGMKSIGVSRSGELDATIAVRSLSDLPPDAFNRLFQ